MSRLLVNVSSTRVIDELHVAIEGSPKKVVVEPTQNVPKLAVAPIGAYVERVQTALLHIFGENHSLRFSEIARHISGVSRNSIGFHFDASVKELSLVVHEKVGKIILYVSHQVSEIILRLHTWVKRIFLTMLDVFGTKIYFRHPSAEGKLKRFFTKALRAVAAVTSTLAGILKLSEVLKTFLGR